MIFGRWMNVLPTVGAIAGAGLFVGVVGGFWYYATPKFWAVGYMPTQPGSGFNHQLHAGKLGMDCRYCHSHVESSSEANIPSASTCFGCHADGHVAPTGPEYDSKVQYIRDAFLSDQPIEWRRVHKVADYVRNFPHHVHVNAGVSCYSCHGQMAGQPVVYQVHSLSMSWCLDCHRDSEVHPEKYIVPKEKVTDLLWVEKHLADVGKALSSGGAMPAVQGFDARQVYESLRQAPPQNCGACHY